MKKIALILLLLVSANASSCWKSVELAQYAQDEFDGKATISIKDAVTCKPISYAQFFIGTVGFKADVNGLVVLPVPPESMDRYLPITIKKKNYITAKEDMYATLGSYYGTRFLLSKELPAKSARFVLSWGERPKDLDLHLKTSSYHISFRKTKSIANRVKLDRDATKGYGPETITVDKLNKNETYRVIVSKFSKSGTLDKNAQVRVYLNNKLDRSIRLKRTSSSCVEVAKITNGKIVYKIKNLSSSECK